MLNNLKDYAVQALVNAVDHLGTVAYKLTELFEQQTVDVSTVELKISCLNQVPSDFFSCGFKCWIDTYFAISYTENSYMPNLCGQRRPSPTADVVYHSKTSQALHSTK